MSRIVPSPAVKADGANAVAPVPAKSSRRLPAPVANVRFRVLAPPLADIVPATLKTPPSVAFTPIDTVPVVGGEGLSLMRLPATFTVLVDVSNVPEKACKLLLISTVLEPLSIVTLFAPFTTCIL